jgi:hypothetical protein
MLVRTNCNEKIVSFVGVDGCLEACHWWIFGSSALIAYDPVAFVGSSEIAKPPMTTTFFTATGWSYLVIVSCKQRACLPICNMVSSFRKSQPSRFWCCSCGICVGGLKQLSQSRWDLRKQCSPGPQTNRSH